MILNKATTDEYLQDMLKDYEKLLQLLISINEHLLGNATFKDLKDLVFEHQSQLETLKEKLAKEPLNMTNSELTQKKNQILENIKTEEEKAKQKIQAGLESIKTEFTRIQELKRVYPNYQKPSETEARFIDNIK